MDLENISPRESVGIVSSRCIGIDAAKGFGIILVLLAHSEFWNFCRTNSTVLFVPQAETLVKLATASYMPLFYVLSGYTFKDTPCVLQARFRRIIVPYFFWGLIALGITSVLIWMNEHSLLGCLKHVFGLLYSRFSLYPIDNSENVLLLPRGAAPLWFLTSLFSSYACFMVLFKCRRYRYLLFLVYVVAIVLLSFMPILLPWSLDTAPAGAIFIYAGYKMKDQQLLSLSYRKLLPIVFSLVILYVYLVSLNDSINMSVRIYGKYSYISPMLFVLIGLIGSYLCCCLCMALEKLWLIHKLAYIGRLSLILLCSHSFIFQISLVTPSLSNLFDFSKYCPLFVVQLALAVIFAVSFVEIKKRWKALKYCGG